MAELVEETTQAVSEASATSEQTPVVSTEQAVQETEQAPVTTEEKPAQETTETKGSEPSKAVRELIDQRHKRQEAERLAAYWKGVAEGRAKTEATTVKADTPVEDQPPVKPKIEDYDDVDKFEEAVEEWRDAKAEYRFAQKIKATQAETRNLTVKEQQKKEYQEAVDAHTSRLEKAKEADPGLDDIINDGNQKISGTMAWSIMQSEEGPKAIRYFYEHPKEAERIFNIAPTIRLQDGRVVPMPGKPFRPDVALMEMGKIMERLERQPEPKTNKQSQAPAPHTPVGGSKGAGPTDDLAVLAKTNPAEYLKRTGALG